MDFIELSSQVVLQCYGQFLEDHAKRLKHSSEKFSLLWPYERNTIHMQVYCEDSTDIIPFLDSELKEDIEFTKTFIALIKKTNSLKQDLLKKFLPKLKYCGEVYFPQSAVEGPNVLIRHVLPLYFEILVFVKKCRDTLIELLGNMAKLHSNKVSSSSKVNIQDVTFISFHHLYQTVGDILLILICIDSSIASYHKDMETKWNVLKQNVLAVSYENNVDQQQVNRLLKMMGEAQSELLTGVVFQNSVKIVEDSIDISLLVPSLQYFLLCQIKEFEYVDDASCQAMDNCAKIIAIFIFGFAAYGLKDKKVQKFILGFAKKFMATALFGQVFWCPSSFISKNNDQFNNELRINQLEINLANYTVEYGRNLISKLKDFSLKVYHWSLKIENCVSSESRLVKLSDNKLTNLCYEGLQLCSDIKYAICSASRFYYTQQKPIPKSLALCFCKLIELLKSVHAIFVRHELLICKSANHSIQKFSLKILNKLSESKSLLSKDSKKSSHQRVLATLTIAENVFYGACTENKLMLVNLLSSFPSNYVDLEYTHTLMKYFCSQLDVVYNLQDFLAETSSNLFGVGERSILPIYLQFLKEINSDYYRTKYVLDPQIWESNINDRQTFMKEVNELLSVELFCPLAQDIETRLRLQAHAHLNEGTDSLTSAKEIRKFLKMQPILVGSKYFSCKINVEKYLQKTFHDLLTVSLHDWTMYREMRSLALYKYNLDTTEDNLPCQTVSLGLDVLEVMRNIHIFVSKYLYNMNNQSFIEFESNNKHLNTITINLIASSIWTHGTGIMNTTTNFIYQYLRKKILSFSQFLFDDNIKSRLLKDYNYLHESNRKKDYTYDRAEKFIKSMHQLGVNKDKQSWMDQYRILVTQIGNALGYVRMVRAGGQHHCLQAASFLPKFLPLSFNCSNLSKETVNAVKTFQDILANIVHNLCGGTEYLKLLVEVFAQVFSSSDSLHLDLFVLIVPPLMVNFVQHMVTAKERINKKSKHGGKFTDDGFPMGIAYLLCMLNLTSQFEALHWFEMVKKKFDDEEKLYTTTAPSDHDHERYENTRQLSLKHLALHRQEFELLFYNVKSAQIIFQGK